MSAIIQIGFYVLYCIVISRRFKILFICVSLHSSHIAHDVVRKRGVMRAHGTGQKPGLAPRLPYKAVHSSFHDILEYILPTSIISYCTALPLVLTAFANPVASISFNKLSVSFAMVDNCYYHFWTRLYLVAW